MRPCTEVGLALVQARYHGKWNGRHPSTQKALLRREALRCTLFGAPHRRVTINGRPGYQRWGPLLSWCLFVLPQLALRMLAKGALDLQYARACVLQTRQPWRQPGQVEGELLHPGTPRAHTCLAVKPPVQSTQTCRGCTSVPAHVYTRAHLTATMPPVTVQPQARNSSTLAPR